MKKEFITNDEYLPLAEKLWTFITEQYPQEPTAQEFAVVIGALEAVKFGITKTLEEQGHRFMVMHQNENPQ